MHTRKILNPRRSKYLLTVMMLTAMAIIGSSRLEAAEFFILAPGGIGDVAGLIDAINQANINQEPDTIVLEAGNYILTSPWHGSTGLPDIRSSIRIVGLNASSTIIERQKSSIPFRILKILGIGSLSLENISIKHGYISNLGDGGGIYNNGGEVSLINVVLEENRGSAGRGGAIFNEGLLTAYSSTITSNYSDSQAGAIFNHSFGIVTILNSTLSGNAAGNEQGEIGGAIYNQGDMKLINSTISGNWAWVGAGILNESATLEVINSTIVRNFAFHNEGGGIQNFGGDVLIGNTIIARNHGGDCRGGVISNGHNLDSDGTCWFGPDDISREDPNIDSGLRNNGGPTLTHALLPGSPAIDAGALEGCPASDQRGAIRPKTVACDIGAFEFGAEDLSHIVRATAGDRDNFHAGDAVDHPIQSLRAQQLVQLISADPGQDPGVGLDARGENRPVGLTHYFALPPDALLTSATVKFRAQVGQTLGYNDGIYYDESASASEQNPDCFVEDHPNCVREPLLPVIVFRDLLGREPGNNESIEPQINLAKVPVRTVDTTEGAGGHWSAAPEEYRSLLPLLFDGEWNMVFSDDSTVDWSELTITYVLPGAPDGDLTGDNLVDRNDLNIIMGARNTLAYGPDDPRDLDEDGEITVLDARKLTLLCSLPRCAAE